MISSVPREYRAFCNSTAQFFLNLFGFLPAPFVYGFVCNLTGGRSSLWGMASLMAWSLFGLINIFFAFQLDKKKRRRLLKEEAGTGSEKEKDQLSRISESSDSLKDKEKAENLQEKPKPQEVSIQAGIENPLTPEQVPPVVKKKSSMMQFNCMKSILITSEIPRVRFPKKKKQRESHLNFSYDQRRDNCDKEKELFASQTLLAGVAPKKEAPPSRLRVKSTSVNQENELVESKIEMRKN